MPPVSSRTTMMSTPDTTSGFNGEASSISRCVFTGRRLVILRQFDAAEWLETVQRERITHTFVVPTMLKRVLDNPAFGDKACSSLKILAYGAAPMPVPVIRQAIAMAYFEGLSHSEISDATGLPLGTVKSRIRLGMHRLKGLLLDAGVMPVWEDAAASMPIPAMVGARPN